MTIRLYDVDSTVSEYSGCRDVNFRWFVVDCEEPVAFVAEAIEVFDLGNSTAGYPVEALDELFTLEEAEMLRDYLERSYGDESVVITERELPSANNTMGLRAIPLGGG
jgi:hypothetical protein